MEITELIRKIRPASRPLPFWSWNDKLRVSETKEQVLTMHNAGIGGFFMHARGGLRTEYMSDEWFENIQAAVDAAKQLGMRPWAYDENGWPSGFGNGSVNGRGVEYQQKFLRMEPEPEHRDTQICRCGGHYFYYDINPFYVDVLDKRVTHEFIKSVYEPYYERFGNDIEGFFTDEPQISRNGIPWSFVFRDEYEAKYNEDLYEHLEELYLPVGEYKQTRIKFWKMVTDLFSQAFFKQIYDWCNERGLKLTGHLVLEEDTETQLTTNGACMPHYEYFNIPGMDWLGRELYNCLTARQVSSVAEQLGKEAVLSETFALCGHNVSFAELKGIYEWQMVRGINILCPHLEGYTLRGIRKRDYPPAMYCQQPWWKDYGSLMDALSRESMILNNGQKKAEVLLLHPQTTAWSLYDSNENKGIAELNEELLHTIDLLEAKHIQFHLGDEIILQRHAYAENGKIIVGEQEYRYVIDSCCKTLLPSTEKLLTEYKAQGGKTVTVQELMPVDIAENPEITYTARYYGQTVVHYFVNSSSSYKRVKINADGKRLDIYTGEMYDFGGEHEFEPWGSLMLIDNGSVNIVRGCTEEKLVYPVGRFRVTKDTLNAVTLDRCDYYFNGILQEKNGYVLNICERANKLECPVSIHQDYHIKINKVPEKLWLVCETPERFEIHINGTALKKSDEGYYLDKSFRKTDISGFVKEGENIISFDCEFMQPEKFYENMRKAQVFESEKNKLAYDTEIEAIYLIGSFGVRTEGRWEKLDRDAVRYNGDFELDELPEYITLQNIEQQGFPFFCGSLVLEGEIETDSSDCVFAINRKGINSVTVETENVREVMLTYDHLRLPKSFSCGMHKIKLVLTNNLRNLLGPHHLEEGETYFTGPFSFYKEKCIWNDGNDGQWNDGYCFVETGVE